MQDSFEKAEYQAGYKQGVADTEARLCDAKEAWEQGYANGHGCREHDASLEEEFITQQEQLAAERQRAEAVVAALRLAVANRKTAKARLLTSSSGWIPLAEAALATWEKEHE